MKFNYQFSNLLGTVYRSGNLIFTPDGNSVISPVGNKISGNMRHVSFKILRYLICHTSENMASFVGFSISQKLTGTEPQIYNSPFPNYSAKSIFLVLSLLRLIKNK